MRRPLTIIVATTLLVAVGACGDDGDEDGPGVEGPCEEAQAPDPKQVDVPAPPAKPAARKLTAVVDTSCGTFEIALDTKENPKTAASFAHLAENGVFDGTAWNRIIPGQLIQGGDPTGTGSGGPGYFVDEPPPADASYTKGVVGMAKTEVEPAGRSGSQFFIVIAADLGLPPQYAIAGEVSSGFGVVRTIEQFGDPGSGDAGTPLEPVLIDSVTIERG